MYIRNIIGTFFSKSIILVLNFIILILTTHIWGSEGRGLIAIIMADLAIIVIFNNILGGNSFTYFLPKIGFSRLIFPGYVWIILSTIIVSFFFAIIQGQHNYLILVLLTLVTSVLSLNLFALVGKEKFYLFNFFNICSSAILLLLILFFVYVLNDKGIKYYFFAYFFSQLIPLIISFFYLKSYFNKKEISFSLDVVLRVFHYGWKNELSYFIQFLSYRLTYFFILYFQDIKSVGRFSVAIAVSESVWLISKSITTVQYARIINLDEKMLAVSLTKSSAKLSFYASVGILLVLIAIPTSIFLMVFGQDFKIVKQLLFLLIPGVLSIAVSNVYGHYFAATNQMRILLVKSAIGLIITVVLSLIMIPALGLIGACIVTSLSYLCSSLYLAIMFYKIPHL